MTVDYQTFTNRDTPLEERRKYNISDIWSNELICLLCNDKIRSKNRHDFVTCKCGNLSVDGGSWYNKISYKHKDSYKTNIEMYNDIKDNHV